VEQEREFSLMLLDGRLKSTINEVNADLEAFQRQTGVKLQREVETAFKEKSQRALDLRAEMEAFLFQSLRDLFTLWRRQEVEKLASKLADMHQEFAGRINAILARLAQLTARIFDFSLRGFSAEEAFMEKSQFSFKFKDEPVGLEILQETITGLLPRALTKGLLLKRLLENVTELVDKHCGRLRYDFHRRLTDLGREFRQEWLGKIDDTTLGIRQALERARAQKSSSTKAAATRREELDRRLTDIERAESRLRAIKERIGGSLH
jgi:hypothetical protein